MADTGTTAPTDQLRRSPLYRVLEAAAANFTEINGAAVAADFGLAEDELFAARSMAIVDLSPLPRVGYKGRGALNWARSHGIEIGDDNNIAYHQPNGELAARLADTEVVVIDNLDGTGALPHRLEAEWSMDNADGAYAVNRQSANFWLAVTGDHAPAMFAKFCGIDLRAAKFPPNTIAQTPVARTSCIVIRDDFGDALAYHLLGDSASAEYLWECLSDAMAEFDGRPVGINVLRRL